MSVPSFVAAGLAALVSASSLLADPILSEFMASNTSALADGDGGYPDWIELYNPDASECDLTGWALRDDQTTWFFAEGDTIAPGQFLVVFASGQDIDDYRDGEGSLHTSFKLDARGEPLALLRPDGSVAFEFAEVPAQREDVSYGIFTQVDTYLTPGSPARHWVPDHTLTDSWIESGYDDSNWTDGSAAVGYHTLPGPVLGGGSANHTAYLVEEGTPGTQSYGGSLGMDFDVLEEIRITHLGVFDDGSDGLSRTITAQLWSRNGNTGGEILERAIFTPESPGALEGGSRFKPLATPRVLPPGSYTIVAFGYGAGEQNGNQGTGALDGLDLDTGVGLIQFVGISRFGSAGSFPTSVDSGPSNRYAAGTFKFASNSAAEIETDVETAMLDVNSTILLRVPFDVSDPASTETLQLEIGFDDGFSAWINGVEIASRNAPAELTHQSAATVPGNALIAIPAVLPEGVLTPTGNVLAIQGLNLAANDDDFVIVPTLSGIFQDDSTARYFTNPTPGAPNDPSGIVGFVADTKFSIDRGFFTNPISVEIVTETAGATIRYTTDGSAPTKIHGMIYSDPIEISRTTVLRAAAFKDGFEPTNVDTHSYLFLADVALQGNPRGYPSSWGPIPADYVMDRDSNDYARAAGDANFTRSQARSAIVDSLQALPTISIVTAKDHLFDPATGIYLNPSGRGEQWERPVSVEIIGKDGLGRYQTDAGLRIMGFTSRNLNTTPKLNMRLLFKKQYGDAQMQHPILGAEGPDEFNTIALRGNIRDAWVAEHQGFGSASYIGDEWAKRTQFDMGQPSVRGTFAHVYLNGIYWGVYNPTERPDDAFAETYLGGDKSEYDVVKFCCPDRSTAGTIARWDQLLNEARAGLRSDRAYQRIQGNDPDGTRNPDFPVLIDMDNFIDYLIGGQFHAQLDWPGNYYVIRDRVESRTEGFMFFTWDNDLPFSGGNPSAGNKVQTSPGHNWWTESPGEIEIGLRANAEYRMRFADRAYKHYHHEGAMTLENNLARWNELSAVIRPALFAESARWGDAKGASLRTVQDHWDAQNARMVNTYFPRRPDVVFAQMRTHGLYPDIDAPEFSQHGGVVAPGFELRFLADATVYYTTDGSDPRLPRERINPAAVMATPRTDSIPINSSTQIRARALDGTEWSALNEATFIVGIPPTPATLAVAEIMYHPTASDPAGEFIEVINISDTETLDLTGVHFSDGIDFAFPLGFALAPGQQAILVRDAAAFASAHPDLPVAGTYSGALNNGGERIAISDSSGAVILSFTYDNNRPWPDSPDGGGPSLVLIAPESAPNHNLPENWRPSTSPGGNPGDSDHLAYPGGDLLAYALAGPPHFDFQSATFSVAKRPGADDVSITPQWSTDLHSWHSDRFEFLGHDPLQWRLSPPPHDQPTLFLRFEVRKR